MNYLDAVIKSIQALIPELTNTSASAVWRRLAEAFSEVLNLISANFENNVAVVQESATRLRFGTEWRYVSWAKAYQQGFTLEVIDPYYGAYGYGDTTSPEAIRSRIIKQASAVQVGSSTVINVATANDAGLLPLNAEQLASVKGYMDNVRMVGFGLEVNSYTPDLVDGTCRCVYDPAYNLSELRAAVSAALVSYELSALNGSTFYINDVETYIRTNVAGVRNFYMGDVKATNYVTGATTNITDNYQPGAGFVHINPNITIDYVAAS